jgi:MFS family permease
MRLFRNQIFTVIVPMMIIMGSLMYGTNAFLPLYLQAVRGVSPTASGLLLVPLMLGVTAAAVVTGRITANTGRYRRWPILGSGMGVVGVALLTQLSADTPIFYTSAAMLILGLGMGMVMPTSTLAVQNSVEFRDMGVGTSMVAFFRTLGGAIGLAVYGALFNARLLASDLNPASLSGGTIQDLPPAALDALSEAVAAIFIVALPVTAIAFALSWFVKEIPLRETAGLGGAEAMVPGEPEAGLEIDAAAAALAAEGASPTTPSRAILH